MCVAVDKNYTFCVLGDRDGEDSVPGDGVCERRRGVRLPGPPRTHEGIYCYGVTIYVIMGSHGCICFAFRPVPSPPLKIFFPQRIQTRCEGWYFFEQTQKDICKATFSCFSSRFPSPFFFIFPIQHYFSLFLSVIFQVLNMGAWVMKLSSKILLVYENRYIKFYFTTNIKPKFQANIASWNKLPACHSTYEKYCRWWCHYVEWHNVQNLPLLMARVR